MTEIKKPPQHLIDALEELKEGESSVEYGEVSGDAATKLDEDNGQKEQRSAVKVRKTI